MPALRSALCLAALSAMSSLAWADNIVVNNSTFSALPAGGLTSGGSLGAWEAGSVPGWVGSGFFGEYQPIVGTTFNSLPGGSTIAFVSGGMLSQDAGTVQANETYTLSVDIGARTDVADGGSIALLINGVTYKGVGTAPGAGGWSVYTVNYSALKSDVGAQIYIELIGGAVGQGDFSNVLLADADPAPEPSTFALLLAGAAATWIGMRHRRKSFADSRT